MEDGYTIKEAADDLDRCIYHLRLACEQIEEMIGYEVTDLTSRIIDALGDVRVPTRLADDIMRALDELSLARGEV